MQLSWSSPFFPERISIWQRFSPKNFFLLLPSQSFSHSEEKRCSTDFRFTESAEWRSSRGWILLVIPSLPPWNENFLQIMWETSKHSCELVKCCSVLCFDPYQKYVTLMYYIWMPLNFPWCSSPLEALTRHRWTKVAPAPVNICACIMLPDQSVGKTEIGPSFVVGSSLPLWLSGDADAVIGHARSGQ